MKINRLLAVSLVLLLVMSLLPVHTVVEARNPNQTSLAIATNAVEKAELHRTWEYVNKAQSEIDNLGNNRNIRSSKEDLQKRLDVVILELNQKATAPPVQEPIIVDPVIEDPVIEEPIISEPIIEEPISEIVEKKDPIFHTVQSGDTLWFISLKYGVTVAEIKELNNLTSDMILVGLVLLISAGDMVQEEVKPEPKPKMILGFYTKYWHTDFGSYNSLTANHQYINSIATASHNVNADGSITGFIPFEAIDFSKTNNIFTFATFQNNFDPTITRAIFTNASLQETVIQNMVKFVKEHGYRGANLNFENMYAADRAGFNQFVEKMTAAFHKEGYPVMVSVPAKTCDCPTWAWSGTFDFSFLGKSNVDYFQIMSYDQHGPWGSPGPVAGYEWMKTVLNYANNHISSEKILLGLPGYGYDWNLSKNTGNRALTLKQIDSLIATHKPQILWNELERTPYFNYVDGNGDRRVVYFDHFESLSAKTKLVHQYNLAGISMWRMGQENETFWQAVETGLNK